MKQEILDVLADTLGLYGIIRIDVQLTNISYSINNVP